jgi:uncharacterized membrane protein
MDWIFFTLLSAVLYSIVELFDKFVVDHEMDNYQIASIFCGIPIYLSFLLAGPVLGSIKLGPIQILLSVFLGVLYTFSLFSYYSGLSKEEVSRFVPSLSLSTVFIVVLSFIFLAETFSIPVYLGIVSVILGALLISIEDPVTSLRKFESGPAVKLGVLTALLGAVSSVLVKFLTESIGMWSIIFWMGIGGLTSALSLGFYNRENISLSEIKAYRHLLVIGFLTAGAYMLFMRAVELGPVSLVSTLLKTNSIMIFVGSAAITWLHPEIISEDVDRKILLQKLLAIALILAGVTMIKLI